MRRIVSMTLVLSAMGWLLVPGSSLAANPYCFNYLDRTTYDSGFSDGDFDARTDVNIDKGKLVLETDDKKLGDTNRIMVRTRQDMKIYYLYESAGGSHTLGWFLWDDNVKKYTLPSGWNYTTTTCSSDSDCDPGMRCLPHSGRRYCAYEHYMLRDDGTAGGRPNNSAFDWFEDLYLRSSPNATPYLLRYPYSDGGHYPHIPNLLEQLVAQGGGWIFLLCDDDWDRGTGGGSPRLPPVADMSATNNGIPDYDVNGDGRIDASDRVREMGTFDAGTELVFFHVMYYGQNMRRYGAGYPGRRICQRRCRRYCWRRGKRRCCGGHYYACHYEQDDRYVSTRIVPFFSKRVLNPDYTASGNYQKNVDIGCGYPNSCSGVKGWLDSATLTRLKNLFGIIMPHEIKTIYVRQNGQMNHMFLGAPSTDPTWWLLGFEDLYNGGDMDYNDIAFLVWRQNGGEAVSGIVSDEIPQAERDQVTITKVHIKKDDYIPIPPCSADPAETRIEYYVSVSVDSNGDPIWIKVEFPADSPNETTIDIQAMGYAGGELRWKAVIIADNHKCHPEVRDVDIGYEALKSGEYVFTSPIPLANVMFRGALETPSKNWTVTGNDRSNRGHFKMFELYAPNDPNHSIKRMVWDAGLGLANRNPDNRKVYTNRNGTLEPVVSPGSSWLLQRILTSDDRLKKLNGKPVYDLDRDRDSDDNDARYIIQWVRGWEIPKSQQRAWKLGAINTSNPAIVHVPGEPAWLEGSGIAGSVKSSYRSWAATQQNRRTVAYVGAQDGMLHAFDAGMFQWGDNPDTASIVEQRGYFKMSSGGQPDYGTGSELWAYVPESLLNYLKNNKVRDYYPEDNPMAMVDGSVSVADIYTYNNWRTALFFSMGRRHPYVAALDVTHPAAPRPLWPEDWTDPDFHGTTVAPTASWVNRPGNGKTWAVAMTSGLSATPSNVYLYLISAASGQTLRNGKVRLNKGGGLRSAKAYGVAGRPVFIDTDGDGFSDRIYVADTSGRVWKHEINGPAGNSCLVAAVGQPIYVTPVFSVREDQNMGSNVVAFYFGTGDRPDTNDPVSPPYYFYAFADRDAAGQCHFADMLYRDALPPGEKVWADAFLATDRVYVGTSTGDKANICDEDPSNPGHVYAFDINPDQAGRAIRLAPPVAAGGSIVSGIMVHDQHLFANTMGGKTLIIGGNTWNNLAWSSSSTGLKSRYWQEVLP